MKIKKLLQFAGVPENLHSEALQNLAFAKKQSAGLTLAKWKVRLFKTKKIAALIPWEAERLIEIRPDLADWDIAPMINITAHGDNTPWEMTADGGRPVPNQWLNKDPNSKDYALAVEANYWCKGEHPRSKKSVKAWYHRNAGEYTAWANGYPVSADDKITVWCEQDTKCKVTVFKCGAAWEILAVRKLIGPLHWDLRIGFEIDNIWRNGVQQWFPISGYDLRAPVTWSKLPKIIKK